MLDADPGDSHWGCGMSLRVSVGHESVDVSLETFQILLEHSIVADTKVVRRALKRGRVPLSDLRDIARRVDTPYPLFFADPDVARAQVEIKNALILEGVSKSTFSWNSRSNVTVWDVELIVKDLLRKQQALKTLDPTIQMNPIVGMLRRSRAGVARDAEALRLALGLDLTTLRAMRAKGAAFNYLAATLEGSNLLVSQSQKDVMLQRLPKGKSLSGIAVRDPKLPYLFVTGGESDSQQEPAGRRILTLTLLAAMVARGSFKPVSFNSQTAEPFEAIEWQLAEEVLMPAVEFEAFDVNTLDAVKALATHLKVTPSATVMRALRLNRLSRDEGATLLEELRHEYSKVPKKPGRSVAPVVAVPRYAGLEYTKRMLSQVDVGHLSARDFCRVVALNRLKPSQLRELRVALQ